MLPLDKNEDILNGKLYFFVQCIFFISLAINYVVWLQILKEELGMGCHMLLQDD